MERKKIPIYYLHEAYFAGEVDLNPNTDLLDALEDRKSYTTFTITPENIKFVFQHLIPEFFIHSMSQDRAQIADHYNRGNDFFEWFLGPMMVYTSGVFESDNDTLEQAQLNKFETIINKLHVKEGEKLLDIGCGWGAFIRHATKKYKLKCTGVSLSSSQAEWHNQKCKDEEIDSVNDCQFQCKDYREIKEGEKYNKITCLEMSEHVGVLKYRAFAKQVYNLLEDDGLFYLQIAGLRMATQIEDYCWAFFMDKYIFPGADASLPLTFPIVQLEMAGFEINSVKNVIIHYSLTINRWYKNWVKNKEKSMSKYGKSWYRLWEWFLAWSTIIARQGNTCCYMIIAHKNLDHFNRKQWVTKNPQW